MRRSWQPRGMGGDANLAEAKRRIGGCILVPSDHFFAADVALLQAFADEARSCVY